MIQIVLFAIAIFVVKTESFTIVDNIWKKTSVPNGHPLFIHDKLWNSSPIKCAVKCQLDEFCVGFNFERDTDICFLYVSLETNNTVSYNSVDRSIFISLIGSDCVQNDYVVFRHLNTCIKKIKTVAVWETARNSCIAEGADLMVVSTLDKFNLFYQPYLYNDWQHVFVGAKNDSTWKWVDGTIAIFREEQPSHPGTANCMEFRKAITQKIKDNDTNCDSKRYFMCEKKTHY